MELKKIISSLLKFVSVAIGCLGALYALGTVGAFDSESITFSQFIMQELISALFIGVAFLLAVLREYFKSTYVDTEEYEESEEFESYEA